MVPIFYQLLTTKAQSKHWLYGSSALAWAGWLTALNNLCVPLHKVCIMYRKVVVLHLTDSRMYVEYLSWRNRYVRLHPHIHGTMSCFCWQKHRYMRSSAVAMEMLAFALAPYYAAACEHAKFNLVFR